MCVAARADQPLLQECLDSVRAAADEVIVAWLDVPRPLRGVTGVAPLASLPAGAGQDHDREAAVDGAIASASGEWILWLHGHERLATAPEAVRAALGKAKTDAVSITIRRLGGFPGPTHRPVDPTDKLTHGARTSADRRSVRLFRRRPEYHFGGGVDLSIDLSLRERRAEVGQSSVEILEHPLLMRYVVGLDELRLSRARALVARHPGEATAWMDLASCLLRADRLAEGRECLAAARRLDANPTTSRRLAQAFLHEARCGDALACLEETLSGGGPIEDAETREEDLQELLGEILREMGRGEAAAAAHLRALALAPDRPIATAALIELIVNGFADGDAAAHAAGLTRCYPGLSISWIAAGLAHLAAGRPVAAIDALRVALDIDPTSAPARLNLGIAYARIGAITRAHEVIQRVFDQRRVLAPWPAVGTRRHRPVDLTRLGQLGAHGVVSYVPALDGGAGRVALDVIRSLHGRPQVLIALSDGDFTGLGFPAELERLGVPLLLTPRRQIAAVIRQLQPGVVIEHDAILDDGPPVRDVPAARVWINHGAAQFVDDGHDWYVCVSDSQRRRHAYLPDGRVEVITNGIDVARFRRARPDWRYWQSTRPETVRIAMLTRLDDTKVARRLPHYLTSLRELDVEIAVAGRGARRWEIQQDLATLAMASTIRFLGPIPSGDVPGFLAAADIGLHLTETDEETCSIAILEMLAAGLPIVSQPRGSLTQLVEDGDNGLLAEGEQDVAARLLSLVRSPADRARMAAASRRRAEAYDLSIFTRRWQGLVDRGRDVYFRRCDAAQLATDAIARDAAAGLPALASRLRAATPPDPPVFLMAASWHPGEARLVAALESTGVVGHLADDITRWRQRLCGRSWRHATFDAYLEARWARVASPRGVYGACLSYDDLEYLGLTHGTADWPERWLARVSGASWIRVRNPLADEDRRWDRFVRTFGIEPVDVYDDDLVADITGTTRRVLLALGIPPPEPFYCCAGDE